MSNLKPDEKAAYQASLKIARDNYSHDETVRKEGQYEKAVKLLAKNTSIEEIVELTGLSKEEIEKL